MAGRWALALITLLALSCILQVSSKSVLRTKARAKKPSTKVTPHLYITSTFCKNFNAECYKVALAGKTGNVEVIHECQRNGGKKSSSYTFGCKANKVDVTTKVLNGIAHSGDDTVAVPNTQYDQTATVTTAVITETLTVATEVATTAVFGNEEVQALHVVLAPSKSKRSKAVAVSQFCSAFTYGCSTQCQSMKTTAKTTLCKSTSVNNYSLSCRCANGKVATQHALYAAASQANKQVSKVAKTSAFMTAAPVPTQYAEQEITTTIAVTATSTTQIVLAVTGAVELRSNNDTSLGYVYTPDESEQLYSYTDDKTEAINYMAALDPSSGLYQLQQTDGSGQVFIAEAGNSGDDYSADDSAYSWLYSGDASTCGAAATAGGHPDGAGNYSANPCETFVFGKDVDAETLSHRQTVNLTMQWYNPSDYFPNQYSWIILDGYDFLISAADSDEFAQIYDTNEVVSLRFPA